MLYFSVNEELDALCKKVRHVDYNELPMLDLCRKISGERYDVVFFELNERSQNMVSKITELKNSAIFNWLWNKSGEKLKGEVVTMEVIYNKIWSGNCEKLNAIYQQFLSGNLELKKVDKYLGLFADYDDLKRELVLLCVYFNGTSNLEKVKKELDEIITKLKSCRKLFDAHQAAKAILELQQKMSLSGDFSEVEEIEEVRQYLCNVPQAF